MKISRAVPAAFLVLGLVGCDDLLDVRPVDEIDQDIAIVDAASAQAALNGAYEAFQDGNYYSTDFVVWPDLMADNAEHEGTFDTYSQADRHAVLPSNVDIDGMWTAMYDGINRANILIQAVPELEIDADVADEIVAEAYALRALHYHNLVRGWGDVPLVLEPPASLDEAGNVSRAPASQVYAQILSDLDSAASLFASAGTTNDDRRFMTPGFVDALRARVNLYLEDWPAAEAAARDVVGSGDYDLVEDFSTLFPEDEGATPEDIFTVVFTPDAFNNLGYYYMYDGRFEVGATQDIYNAYDQANDERWAWTFGDTDVGEVEVTKYPTTIGAENVHVIRYADVLLILAEALAQQGGVANLTEAVSYLNEVRDRAGVDSYDLVLDFATDQQAVIDAIWLERRLELAFEGDRWFDLVRTGRAVDVLPTLDDERYTLWPIPQGELDVAPNLVQNPGY